jgi:hypothetical protein
MTIFGTEPGRRQRAPDERPESRVHEERRRHAAPGIGVPVLEKEITPGVVSAEVWVIQYAAWSGASADESAAERRCH